MIPFHDHFQAFKKIYILPVRKKLTQCKVVGFQLFFFIITLKTLKKCPVGDTDA